MASKVFDTSELDSFSKSLLKEGILNPRKQKKFLEEKGTHLRAATISESKKHGKSISKMIRSSTSRGKFYKYKGAGAIRVYSNAPHAHLIEDGHRMVTHDGREVGFVPGHHIFSTAAKKFEPYFQSELVKMIDKEFDKL